jgi:hypothetical protein
MGSDVWFVDRDIQALQQATREPGPIDALIIRSPRGRVLSSVRLEYVIQYLMLPRIVRQSNAIEVV